ncbi:lysine--tRNA ligase [Patescibacteria group bacterium]|nr:MAG: lysine--tRNA ligase [Patescibacteria group bacterium]
MSVKKGLEELRAVRLRKRDALLAGGQQPYPDRFSPTHACANGADGDSVRVCGRLMSLRDMGKTIFGHLQDDSGRVQLMLRKNEFGDEPYARFRDVVDIGDILGCEGRVMYTRSNERTVQASDVIVLAKSLLPLPDKFHGLTDDETRFGQRYLEIITDRDVRERFRTRSRVIRLIRGYLDERGFEEVDTPLLQAIPSGAQAAPFETHHRASGRTLYLRIAPETYLKRLIVAGYDKVYEIGRNFRNEGMDRSHLQEFTMLEYYCAWWNMWDNVRFIREMLQHLIHEVCGSLAVPLSGLTLDFSGEWPTVEYRDLVLQDCGIDVLAYDDVDALRAEIARRGIAHPAHFVGGLGTVIDKLYKLVSRPKLVQPTFLVHHPAALSPLARPNDKDPRVVDQFQLLVNGWEIVKAYSELVDPILQRARLEEQARAKEDGDEEAMSLDEPYLQAMEYGMPPNSGLGLGVDRLVALLTGQTTLKEAVIFPIGT